MIDTTATPRLDEDGFLPAGTPWDKALALELARREGIDLLTDEHWRVLDYLREHYLAARTLPVERTVCRELHLVEHCIEKLFGSDLRRAWRVAGLPNPGEEAKSYMGQKSSSDRL